MADLHNISCTTLLKPINTLKCILFLILGEEKMAEEDKIMSQMPESMRQLRRFVKDKISDKWELIAIQLEFTIVQIQGIKDNHKERSVVTCCTEMLFDWVDSTESKKPANDLVEAIREVEFGYQADQIEKG